MAVEVLIGNIASGKSTYCRKRAKEGAIVMNDDAVVNGVHCDMYTLYSKELKPLYKAVENAIVTSAIMLGRDVIVDRGVNLTPRSRRRFVGLAHSLDVDAIAVVFEFCDPIVHAQRRAKDNLRGHSFDYWLDVATTFHNKFVSPEEHEGFDKVINI